MSIDELIPRLDKELKKHRVSWRDYSKFDMESFLKGHGGISRTDRDYIMRKWYEYIKECEKEFSVNNLPEDLFNV